MERREVRQKTVRFLIVLIAFGILMACMFGGRKPEKDSSFSVVLFGDSVYGNIRDATGVVEQLEELTGREIYNAAIGGTTIGRWDGENRLDYSEDALSVVALTKAVYAGDFGVQKTMDVKQGITNYFPDVVSGLEKIDFSAVELVIIGGGTNDYYDGILRENAEDPMDEYTFAGALRSAVSYLRKVNPKLRILLITPTYSWLLATGQTCEEYDLGGLLEEYVETELAVAEELGVEALDLYHDLYPHDTWEDWQIYTFDGLHPNEEGRALIAGRIAAYLETD